MSQINVLIVNRNLLTTTKNTIEFLRKEDRVKVHILDQASTYPPLLEWYKTIPEEVIYCKNEGPYSCWDPKYKDLRRDNFIVADSDCLYNGVPDNWLDVMLEALENSPINKVGFSLTINDLPKTKLGNQAYVHEIKYWQKKVEYGWDAHVDTTFALYRENVSFTYDAIRLDAPYSIQHLPWYLDVKHLPKEWKYYIEHAGNVSTWGSKIKKALK